MTKSEKEISELLQQHLSLYFYVNTEIWSKCGKYRIDLIIKDKNSEAIFGIEIKKIDYKRGHDIGEHIKQAINYSNSEFIIYDKFIKIPVFVAPPISYTLLMCPEPETMKIIDGKEYFHDRHEKTHEHHTVNGMVGALGIGEIRTYIDIYTKKQYMNFMFSNKIIWSSRGNWNYELQRHVGIRGLHRINYDFLIKNINE